MVLPIRTKTELEGIVALNKAVGIGRFYNIRRLSITYVTYVFLLLTFGLGYPPLAALILVSSAVQTIVLQLCIRNHYLQVNHDESLFDVWNQVLEHEIRDLNLIFSGSKVLSFVMSSLFVSFFIVDMTINENTLCAILLPIILVLATLLICYRHELFGGDENISQEVLSVDNAMNESKDVSPQYRNRSVSVLELRPNSSNLTVSSLKSMDNSVYHHNPMQSNEQQK